jgi:hypothetical protein
VCKKCVFYACILCVNLCVHFMCAFYVWIWCVRKMCIWMCAINVCLETEF